jgi:hypothetical protein
MWALYALMGYPKGFEASEGVKGVVTSEGR